MYVYRDGSFRKVSSSTDVYDAINTAADNILGNLMMVDYLATGGSIEMVSGQANIVTAGNSIDISARFLDANDNPISGAYLVFDIGGVVSTSKTNQQGIASVTYDGTGAGVVNINVAYGGRISLQETYELYDFIILDDEITSSKNYNTALSDIDFYLEFIVHPSASSDSIAYLTITDGSNHYLTIGDLYSSTNVNCGVNWTGGTFYGKAISIDTDTKITLQRTGTSMVLTVGESTYNITNMDITCSTLVNAVITNNAIKDFKIYPI